MAPHPSAILQTPECQGRTTNPYPRSPRQVGVLPLGHAAFAYLSYVGVAAVVDRRLPARLSLIPLAFASQLPDLIDKPLAFYGVLVSGRAFGHSLLALLIFTALVLVGRVWVAPRVARPRLRELLELSPLPFAVGYASHLVGDAYPALLAGQYGRASYLLWPLLPAPQYPGEAVAPWIRLARIYRNPGTHDQLPLVGLALVVFVALRVRAYWRGRARPD